MRKHILDALECALIVLLLASSYAGFSFILCFALFLAGVTLTKLIIVLVFLCGCSLTHLILRWLCDVQSKGWVWRGN